MALFQEPSMTKCKDEVSMNVLIVLLEGTVKVKETTTGQRNVQLGFSALGVLITCLLMMGSLE